MRIRNLLALLISPMACLPVHGVSQSTLRDVRVNVTKTLEDLLRDEDTDGDHKITINDSRIDGTDRGDKRFWLIASDSLRYEISGTYFLSNLLEELKLAADSGLQFASLRAERLFEKPSDRISRLIREIFWRGLTRRIDEENFLEIISDEKFKAADGYSYLYVPASDSFAVSTFEKIPLRHPDWKVRVERLPEKIVPQYVHDLAGRHGLLSLALDRSSGRGIPFVVPGGRFNEMYGWDSYFIVLGLLQDGNVGLARSMVDNFVYEISYYGAVLNANRTYYLTRSQPPFLTSMILAVYDSLPKNSESQAWLERAARAAIREYTDVWMNSDRLTWTGLSRYFDSGAGPPPEVEPGHFREVFLRFALKHGMSEDAFARAYLAGEVRDAELDEYFVHDRCMRESGHDTSFRLEGCCADLVTVDLNSLLYRMELDIASIIRKLPDKFRSGAAETPSAWEAKASWRKRLMNEYLWDEERGIFFDYNFVKKSRTGYVSATTLYPLWAGLASKQQASRVVKYALPRLTAPGGIVSSAEPSRGSGEKPLRQWDYPYGWAPHQVLVWKGLQRYGYKSIAEDLAYRWLYTITVNAANFNGTVPEKFDVVTRSHQVFAEYGNVGTTFSYITREGFGWTNASYQLGRTILTKKRLSELNDLIPPEWLK